MALPRIGKFNPDTTISWSNGDAFDGFILVGLVPPTSGGTDWAEVRIRAFYPTQAIPDFARVPIVNGKYNSQCGLFFNADLEPPNTQYVAWFYDSTSRQIGGPTTKFTVSADPFTPPTVTLTAPTLGTTNPTPDT